jgi:sugar phosphate isomerase/epimerase
MNDRLRHARRDFLRLTAGCAAAAAVMRPRLVPAVERGMRMSFGLVTYLWGRDWDLPTLIHNCEQTQVLGVELRTMHAHGVEPDLSRNQRRDVAKRFADSPVTLVGLGTNEHFDDPDPARLHEALENSRAFVRLSHDVGGSGVKVKPNNLPEGVPKEKTIEQIGRALNELAQFGAEYGQQIRLEVHGQCSELPTIKAIMDVAQHKNVGICWNSNEQDLSGGGLESNFRLVRDRFGDTVHVRELNDPGYPYQQLMDLLAGTDYDGWVLLEARTDPADRVAALAEQRKLFSEMISR